MVELLAPMAAGLISLNLDLLIKMLSEEEVIILWERSVIIVREMLEELKVKGFS